MVENYMKRIESLITPNNYSRENFRDKLQSERIEDDLITQELKPEGKLLKAEDEILTEQVEQGPQNANEKLLKKRIETEGKLESPEEIKYNSSKSVQSALINTKKSIRSMNNEGDTKSLLEKIHNLNLKNMTYRNDIEKYKNKINALTAELSNQNELIAKYEQEKESSCQYLFKLEKMLNNKQPPNLSAINSQPKQIKTQTDLPISLSNDNDNNEQSDQNSVKGNKSMFTESNISVEVTKNNCIVIDDKKSKEQFNLSSASDIKDFIKKLYKENQKLKIFQRHVFEISQSYDDINDNLHESIVKIQEIVSQGGKGAMENELVGNYQKLVSNVNETLKTKQREYNLLLQEKDEQITLIQEELLILSKEIDERKKDRTKELQIITNLEEEVRCLKEKLIECGYNPANSKKDGFIPRGKQNPTVKIEKKIESAKTTLSSIVKQIESNLDMKDQSNAKMLGALTKVVSLN